MAESFRLKRFLVLFVILVLVGYGLALAGSVRELNWEQLVPVGPPIEDPLAGLTDDQAVEVELIATFRDRRKLGLGSDVDDESELTVELEHKLKQAGLDVDSLVQSYKRMQAEVRRRNDLMVLELDRQMVRVPGYALPLEFDGTAVKEFLLVPYVGACIHVPPPPKNQMVFVKLKQSFPAKTLYEPVWVTGRMKVQSTTKSLSLVDGKSDVHAGYTINAVQVEAYKE